MTSSDQPQTVAQQALAASRAGGPRFAVVIASSGARSWLSACLSSLIPQCLRNRIELIVARPDSLSAMQQLSTAYPYARFISAPPRTAIPELRRSGLAAANADA